MNETLNQLINGIGIGLIYFLIAVGLTLILGVQNFVNFSHGALYMVGAYIAYTMELGWLGFWPALIIGPVVVGILSLGIERLLLRRMYGLPHQFQIVATFGLALVIAEVVTIIWGTHSHTVAPPVSLAGTFVIGSLRIPVYRTFVIGLTLFLALLLWLALERTRFGAVLRAGSESPEMVSALGINIDRVFAITFMVSGSLAAVGGVLSAPLQSISPQTGNAVIVLAFVVVVLGGMGSFGGALVAALLIGLVQAVSLLVWPAGAAIAPFILMALILVVRPDGLFGRLNAEPS